uniref:UMP-CMP kinase n=1 Tax=Caligus rogercresseyi TaxID=217165 RepID=C1BQT0_CALRO|nr:UMP-CMP kinase [Caligus rogercresseyi]
MQLCLEEESMFSRLLVDLVGRNLKRISVSQRGLLSICENSAFFTKRDLSSLRKLITPLDMSEFDVIFVLGGPGAGKGTQCSKIVEKYGFKHLSAGELLREEMANKDSEYGDIIKHHMVSGSIVPASITCALLKNAMIHSGSPKQFLIDGFPRNQDNVDAWEKSLSPLVNFRFCPILRLR